MKTKPERKPRAKFKSPHRKQPKPPGAGAGAGRPTLFTKEFVLEVERMARAGFRDERLQEYFGVSESTFTNWKKKHPEFLLALKRGRDGALVGLVDAGYSLALGGMKVSQKLNKDGEAVDCLEYFSPDGAMLRYLLNNRAPDLWRNQPEISAEVNASTLKLPDWLITAANQKHRDAQG